MAIDFNDLNKHVVPITDFTLHWRFTDEKYCLLPPDHLSQLKALDKVGAKFLSTYISHTQLHFHVPFKHGFFRTIDKARVSDGNEKEIKKWLYQRGLPFDKEVYLSWSETEGMLVPWKIFIKYFDAFYYPASDDLTIFDQGLTWAVLCYHENEFYFGTNNDHKPGKDFDDVSFIW